VAENPTVIETLLSNKSSTNKLSQQIIGKLLGNHIKSQQIINKPRAFRL
jgi:hypothetical protein